MKTTVEPLEQLSIVEGEDDDMDDEGIDFPSPTVDDYGDEEENFDVI